MDRPSDTNLLIYRFFHALFRRKWTLILVFLGTVLFTLFATFLIDQEFEGVSTIQINGKQSIISIDSNNLGLQPDPSSIKMLTNVALMESDKLTERVVDKTGFTETYKANKLDPDLRDKLKGYIVSVITSPILFLQAVGVFDTKEPDWRYEAHKEFVDGLLTVEWDTESQMIFVTVAAEEPEISNTLSNAMVDEFLALNVENTKAKYENMLLSVEPAQASAEAQLASADEALYLYKKENNISELSSDRSIKVQHVAELGSEKESAEAQATELAAQLASINSAIKKEASSESITVLTTRALEGDPEIQSLTAQLADLEKALAALMFASNDVTAITDLQREIDDTQTELEQRTSYIMSSQTTTQPNSDLDDLSDQSVALNAQILGLNAKASALGQEEARQRAEIGPMSELEMELTALVRTQAAAERTVEDLTHDLNSIRTIISSNTSEVDARVIDRAHLTEDAEPDFPSWPIAAIIGLFAGTLFSLIGVLVIEYFRDEFSRGMDISARYGVPVLGEIAAARSNETLTTGPEKGRSGS